MLPTLSLGRLAIPTYPLLLIFSFYAGLWLAAKVIARRGTDPDILYNAGFAAAVAAIVAGRLGHILFHLPAYAADPLSMLSPNLAAFQPWFAVGAALLVFAVYQRRYQVSILDLLDALSVGALLTLSIIALADGLNARNFGQPTLLPWAVTQWSVARHPVQYYEMVGTMLVIAAIWRSLPHLRPGEVALSAWAGYAAVRLFVDAFRAESSVMGDGFRISQVIALTVLMMALLFLYQSRSRSREEDLPKT